MLHQCEQDSQFDDHGTSPLIEFMLHRESTTYAQQGYFTPTSSVSPDAASGTVSVDRKCRYVMTKWCYNICKFCNYDRSMVAPVIYCVDLFVATPLGSKSLLNRDQYQLVVMASLYLVTKIHQTQALEPTSMAKLSRGKYSKEDIEKKELEILMALKWNVNPPTPMMFANAFVRDYTLIREEDVEENFEFESENEELSSSSLSMSGSSLSMSGTIVEGIVKLVNCQVEEAACDYELSCLHRPSLVAFGAILNALESLGVHSCDLEPMQKLKQHLDMKDDDIMDATIDGVRKALLRIISTCEDSSKNSACALLMQRCGTSDSSIWSNDSNDDNEAESNASLTSNKAPAPPSSCSSPRTVVGGIPC